MNFKSVIGFTILKYLIFYEKFFLEMGYPTSNTYFVIKQNDKF